MIVEAVLMDRLEEAEKAFYLSVTNQTLSLVQDLTAFVMRVESPGLLPVSSATKEALVCLLGGLVYAV